MNKKIPVLTIDGPAGSGKGTVARIIAQKLGWHVLDSGVLYRLLAYAAQQNPIKTAPEWIEQVQNLNIRFEDQSIYLDDQEVSTLIRQPAIGKKASQIAALPEVRAALLDWQRQFVRPPGLVADGRDMGTVVFPQAVLKIFLDASVQERAKRRYKQLKQQGINANLSRLIAEIEARDHRDRHRRTAPLKAAPDALIIDSTELSIDQVVEWILHHLKQPLSGFMNGS